MKIRSLPERINAINMILLYFSRLFHAEVDTSSTIFTEVGSSRRKDRGKSRRVGHQGLSAHPHAQPPLYRDRATWLWPSGALDAPVRRQPTLWQELLGLGGPGFEPPGNHRAGGMDRSLLSALGGSALLALLAGMTRTNSS